METKELAFITEIGQMFYKNKYLNSMFGSKLLLKYWSMKRDAKKYYYVEQNIQSKIRKYLFCLFAKNQ